MQFITTSDRGIAAAALRTRLEAELAKGYKVLWLVSGGSNIAITVAVMHVLSDELTRNLTIMPVDERHGEVGHADSNSHQLYVAGFDRKHATVVPVLAGDRDLGVTRDTYDASARLAFNDADMVIGQFGIGADGHIAGILPESEATQTTEFVAAYQTEVYDRLTLTAHALKRINVAYVFAFGDDKQKALERLVSEPVPYEEQPAQVLKELPEVYIFNDSIGDPL